MNIEKEIEDYISSIPEPKQSDMRSLHQFIQSIIPNGKLWYMDGKNSENKVVSNPNIGYGFQKIKYTDGKTRDFYQIGISANQTGISVYILGLKDKTYLAQTYGKTMGKASISGYCIKFKSLKNIELEPLESAIRYGIQETNEK